MSISVVLGDTTSQDCHLSFDYEYYFWKKSVCLEVEDGLFLFDVASKSWNVDAFLIQNNNFEEFSTSILQMQ